MKTTNLRVLAVIGLLVFAGAVGSAFAAGFTFNFNGIAAGAQSPAIQTYMNGVLGAAGTVALSGAQDANGYTGDGHVVGPCVGTTCTSKTLANDNDGQPGTDHMIMTMQTGGTDTIKMQFTGLKLLSVTFDFEIFPDQSCPSPASCPTKPDFIFYAGNGGSTSLVTSWLGAFPATGSHSPFSTSTGTETSAQLIGSYTYTPGGTFDTIWFQDWPATIGVDNVQITTQTQVPEPASLFLVGSGVLAVIRRKKSLMK